MNDRDWLHWGECYYDHLQQFLGDPISRGLYEIAEGTPQLQILVFNHPDFLECRIFCSFGLTHYEIVHPVSET